MQINNIPKIKNHWVDSLFRVFRKMLTLEKSVLVLITAEIIAVAYYDALGKPTNSKTLKDICKQILKDEHQHINFCSLALRDFFNRHRSLKKFIIRKIL